MVPAYVAVGVSSSSSPDKSSVNGTVNKVVIVAVDPTSQVTPIRRVAMSRESGRSTSWMRETGGTGRVVAKLR